MRDGGSAPLRENPFLLFSCSESKISHRVSLWWGGGDFVTSLPVKMVKVGDIQLRAMGYRTEQVFMEGELWRVIRKNP